MYFGELENGVGTADDLASELFPQNGEFQKLQTIVDSGRFGVSAVGFDQNEELVWTGNNGGHVTSYYGNSLDKYTSFQVHATQEIRQILTTPEIVLILSPSQLKGQIRRGLSVFSHTSENMQEMQCMLQVTPTNILMGGHSGELIDFDLPTSSERKTMSNIRCAILRNIGRYICSGEPSGQIHLLDPRSLRKEHTIDAHSGSLSDFDVHGNMMVTCGFSTRHGNLSVDRFVKVYDIRNLRAMAPIQVSVDPFLLRFLPSFSARIATVSPSGQMELLETQAVSQTNISLYQVTSNASMCLSFDVSTTCNYLVFGDSTGNIHLFSSNASATFNTFSRDTEFPDPVEPLPPMSFTDEFASFATIPLLMNNTPLLSDWPPEYCTPVYRTICAIDPAILQSVKMVGTIGYARNPNPGTFRRNQSKYTTYESGKTLAPSPNNNSPTQLVSKSSPQPTRNNGIGGGSGSASPSSNNKRSHFPRQLSPQHPHHHTGPHHPPHLPPGPPPPFFYQHGPPAIGPNGPPRPYFHNKSGPPYYKGHFHQGRRGQTHVFNRYQIPKRYAKYDWKKNYFEESDMEPFNKTLYSGLEANQANCYCNAVLQVLYHIEYLRNSLISHLCVKENCLACELAFLFHMLSKSRTRIPCAAGNFLRAFRLVPEASALCLIIQENQAKQRGTYFRLIQSFNRFILHQLQSETSAHEINSEIQKDPITLLFEIKQENVNRCVRCGREEKKESTVYLSNLLYSPDSTNGSKRCKFVDLLQRSLCPEQTTPAWCENCGSFQKTFQSRVPKSLPPLISLNTCLDNAHDFQTWRSYLESSLPDKSPKSEDFARQSAPITITPAPPGATPQQQHAKSCRYGKGCMRPDCKFWHEGRGSTMEYTPKITEFEVNPETQVKWLPIDIRLTIEDHKRVRCVDLVNLVQDSGLDKEDVRNGIAADYELTSVVCFVKDPDAEDKCNLVSLIRIENALNKNGEPCNSNWFLFNDFCVREASATEAVSFNPKWKIPCVIYYRKKENCLPEHIKTIPPICQPITEDVFKAGNTLGKERKNQTSSYTPLDPDEIPKVGELVAMDAEFVTLGQEETELRTDGKLQTVKPQMVTVARVTCIRAQGPLEGTPFLDDYISTQESQVVDYLTKFSGINPGDLDANYSSKNLAILKTVYLKLRYLIDNGVKFVGHGLNNDFRVINLVVPSEQIIDTVNLFFLPNQRLISLRFLAWHFLGIVIQSEVHDSIEDARTALQLFRKYEELKKSGQLEKELENLYEVGKRVQWKVPANHTLLNPEP